MAAFAGLGVRLEEARSRLCHGERLRRAGRRVQARAQLRAALALFERMRCAPWIERTESELRRAARRCAHAGRAAPIDELTPQELQVATLAAAGLSNKEVAARLFLSVKTIEAHLHRTYRKLGVRSRRELPSVIGTADASASSRGTSRPRATVGRLEPTAAYLCRVSASTLAAVPCERRVVGAVVGAVVVRATSEGAPAERSTAASASKAAHG